MDRGPAGPPTLPASQKEDVTMESPEEHVEQKKATVRRMLERLSAGDIDGFMEGIGPDYVRHCQAMPPELQEIRGRDTLRQWLVSNKETFPDYNEEIQMLVGEGDFVAWRSVGRGTQMGALGPFPATQRAMELVIMGMHRFDNGLIAETWTSWDNFAALTQLGLLAGV
jgi:predicted ester cyclase